MPLGASGARMRFCSSQPGRVKMGAALRNATTRPDCSARWTRCSSSRVSGSTCTRNPMGAISCRRSQAPARLLERAPEWRRGGAELGRPRGADGHPLGPRPAELLAEAAARPERGGPGVCVPLGLLADEERRPGERVDHPLLHPEEGEAPAGLERAPMEGLGDGADALGRGERSARGHPRPPGVHVGDAGVLVGEPVAEPGLEHLEGGRVPAVAAEDGEDAAPLGVELGHASVRCALERSAHARSESSERSPETPGRPTGPSHPGPSTTGTSLQTAAFRPAADGHAFPERLGRAAVCPRVRTPPCACSPSETRTCRPRAARRWTASAGPDIPGRSQRPGTGRSRPRTGSSSPGTSPGRPSRPRWQGDLAWLDARPGQKVLLRGNHDFWWGDSARQAPAAVRALPFASSASCRTRAVALGPYLIAGIAAVDRRPRLRRCRAERWATSRWTPTSSRERRGGWRCLIDDARKSAADRCRG